MLHKLPKDLLVKLVATIREDTEKKYVELLRQCSGANHHFCSEMTCKAFAITSRFTGEEENDFVIFNSDDRKFRSCSMCERCFCNLHDQIMECASCKKLLCVLCYEKYERKYFKKVNKTCSICNLNISVLCRYCDRVTIECSDCKKEED